MIIQAVLIVAAVVGTFYATTGAMKTDIALNRKSTEFNEQRIEKLEQMNDKIELIIRLLEK